MSCINLLFHRLLLCCVNRIVPKTVYNPVANKLLVSGLFGWLVGCVLCPIDSEVIKSRHPYLLSLEKDMKLGKYTVSTGNRTIHYTSTVAPRKLHTSGLLT